MRSPKVEFAFAKRVGMPTTSKARIDGGDWFVFGLHLLVVVFAIATKNTLAAQGWWMAGAWWILAARRQSQIGGAQ